MQVNQDVFFIPAPMSSEALLTILHVLILPVIPYLGRKQGLLHLGARQSSSAEAAERRCGSW